MKERILNELADLKSELHWWTRNDVSFKFKIMNLISGDRLRVQVASTNHNLDQIQEMLDKASAYENKYTCEDYRRILRAISMYKRHAQARTREIWTL